MNSRPCTNEDGGTIQKDAMKQMVMENGGILKIHILFKVHNKSTFYMG